MDQNQTNTPPAKIPDATSTNKKKKKKKKKKKEMTPEEKARKAALKAQWAKGAKKNGGGGGKKKKKKVPPTETFVNKTPEGDKKDITEKMLDKYSPPAVEAAWQAWWEKCGFYGTDVEKAKAAKYEDKFVIVIPPPNVTGTLHLGHALTCSIQDTVCRWHRMHGKHVMWVPGTDHAGIATQSVVEKRLYRESKKTRHDLGREKFLEQVWKWKDEKGNRITTQLRRLGASVDWKREVFTMDKTRSVAVTEAFCRMFKSKKIYRANRLVNWCPHLRTALSNIEVDDWEIKGKTMRKVPGGGDKLYPFGIFQKFAYKIENGSDEDELVVATTRLETMLGDTAVAVHPKDPRYAKYHGKYVIHPIDGRRIPIVLDDILVDMSKGTGCVKITPSHDENDFKCGERHKLQFINILTDSGHMNENVHKDFQGMFRYDVRLELEKRLSKMGLYRGTEEKEMVIGTCSRSGDIIEPLQKPQWWVDTAEMSERAMKAVEDGELKLIPKDHAKTWNQFLGNKRPWCISRQLWWGHRIPAYLIKSKKNNGGVDENSSEYNSKTENWVVARSKEEAMKIACQRRGVSSDEIVLEQDSDVLDTWFSSGLFPFSVFGWPENTDDLQAFFPTHLLETGLDILFFWVARMVMMSLELQNQLPFKEVYLHAMVRDARGRKMSKSLGNVIDPLEIIDGATLKLLHAKLRKGNLNPDEIKTCEKEQKSDFPNGIPQCGTDALRYTLTQYCRCGRSVNLNINAVVSNRAFCNKLWQASRFLMEYCLPKDFKPEFERYGAKDFAPRDKWILSRLNDAAKIVNKSMLKYDFGEVAQVVQSYIINDLCNTYLELVKPTARIAREGEKESPRANISRNVLWYALEQGLRLLHPMMPYITEELWQRLTKPSDSDKSTIMLCAYPVFRKSLQFQDAVESTNKTLAVIGACTKLRAQYKLTNKTRPKCYVITNIDKVSSQVKSQIDDIVSLGRVDEQVEILTDSSSLGASCVEDVVDDTVKIALELKGMIDVDNEIKRYQKKLKKLLPSVEKESENVKKEGIPEKVRVRSKARLEKLVEEKSQLESLIKKFEAFRTG